MKTLIDLPEMAPNRRSFWSISFEAEADPSRNSAAQRPNARKPRYFRLNEQKFNFPNLNTVLYTQQEPRYRVKISTR